MRKHLISLLIALTAFHGASQQKLTTQTYVTADNAYQNSIRQYGGYERAFTIQRSDTSLPSMKLTAAQLIGWRCYFMDGVVTDFKDARTSITFSPNRRFFANANVSLLGSSAWSPVFFDGFLRYHKSRITAETFVERESVGTPITNQLRYVSTTAGLSVDFRINRRLTTVNGFAMNSINDGSIRWYQTHRLIYTLKGGRHYIDAKTRVMFGSQTSPYYFSPLAVNQYNVGYGIFMPTKNDKLYLKAYVGLGIQEVNHDHMSMFNVDLKATSNFDSRWNGEIIFTTRNFNEYIFNTFSMRIFYKFR